MTKMHKIFSYILFHSLCHSSCQGYYRLSFTFPASTAPFLHVTCFTQFRDYRHEGHMFECPVHQLHLSIFSSVSDARIFLMNNLFLSFSLAYASCDLDARYCLFRSRFFSLCFAASFSSSITLTFFLGPPLLLFSSIPIPCHFTVKINK